MQWNNSFWLCILLFSSFARAGGSIPPSSSCEVKGNKDFVATINVTGSNSYQEFYFTSGNGNQRQETLWYTGISNPNPDYLFNEQNLTTGSAYVLRFDHDADTNMSYYYRRSPSDNAWQFIESVNKSIENGNISGNGVGVGSYSCEEVSEVIPPPVYSSNAQYEFGTKQCSSMPCTIEFTKDYDFAPLVFVMPTIDTVSPDEDKPATLYISSELTADSTSVQITKDTINLLQMDNDVPITEVSYLIIEPGVASFNGHEVIAGYVDTNANDSKSHTGNSANVPFSDFGKQGSFNSPIVLHQIQTRNNGDKWMTSGKLLTGNDNNSARLFLELSASRDRNHNYVEERIAFIATNSLSALEVDGYNIHFGRGFRTPDQTGNDPMEDGCTRGYASIPLDGIDGIIGKKQERNGGHGGWARRCEIKNDNQVSFAIDEDFLDRTHLREELGYFAFERLEIDIDICTYFPEPVQSWGPNGELNLRSPNILISGWSEEYQSQYFINGSLQVPFDATENANSLSQLAQSCVLGSSTEDCALRNGILQPPLIPIPPALDPEWGQEGLVLDFWNMENCTNSTSCSFTDDGTTIAITISDSLRSLKVSNYTSRIFTVTFLAKSGDGISIEDYFSDGKVESIFEANSNYTFGSFTSNGTGGKLTYSSNVILNIESTFLQDTPVEMTDTGGLKDLIVYGPTADVTIKNVNSDVYLNIVGLNVHFTNQIILRGSVSSNNLIMDVSGSRIVGEDNFCSSGPPSGDYQLVLTPATDIALTCETIPLTATVYKDDAVDNSFNGNITLSVDGLDKETKAANSGIATFDLSATQASTADAEVTTTIDGGSYSDTGNYKFVPYRFDVPDQYLIAMKPESVAAKVLACNSGNAVDVGYSGTPTITSNMVQPSSGSGTLTYAPIFSGGTSTDESSSIEFSESGQLTVTLIDTSFNCVGYDDCPIEGEDELTGVFTVNSRPWTFAICSEDNVSGGANGGVGYKESGEVFATQVKPIVWQTDGSTSGVIETSGYCGAAVTQNFFISGAPSATVEMTHEVATPLGGVDGQLSGSLLKSHDSSVGFYNYSDLSWDEVGSVRLLVDTQGTYLEMDINQGSRSIGRFYPAFFKVIDTRWDYPDTQTHAYMGQPFDGLEFDVEALNSSNNAVQNYPLFVSSLHAKFNLYENSTFSARLTAPALEGASWAVDTNRSIGTFSNSANNDCTDSICWLKQTTFVPDGPFNAAEAIEDSTITIDGTVSVTNIDPIAYATDGAILTDQPDIRFGRMSLKDVGGNQNTVITVPLTVEYWNGSRFITNTDDNSTKFDGDDYCQQVIWSDLADNASLSEDDTVSLGESRSLLASQTTSVREQIRFWLTLDSTAGENGESDGCNGSDNELPWLRYNWDGADTDEEDPSTVVTFGIHRGNDRVIYRGESGLIGQ
ncbi:DUF6701 domain-containing protein [Vibrio genomosp. F10 str. 9ZC157]|uniref:DUF6701 domain-containing protein n=1 Tax=Vibrio genomosp. F10 TaxID=723171 RepID=UPI0003099B53|nr:DUF6701 domain-containing protein [Vibrio genomosp. F10]OEE96218.1 hypothetical protein A1QM_03755 [Vibrio genomosp. F10 str. 9ZC157]